MAPGIRESRDSIRGFADSGVLGLDGFGDSGIGWILGFGDWMDLGF